mgnify:CR=1 FL=1
MIYKISTVRCFSSITNGNHELSVWKHTNRLSVVMDNFMYIFYPIYTDNHMNVKLEYLTVKDLTILHSFCVKVFLKKPFSILPISLVWSFNYSDVPTCMGILDSKYNPELEPYVLLDEGVILELT